MELGIIPGVPGAEGYVELGATGQGRVFRKHLITIGKTFLHPKTGKPITLGEADWRAMKDSFDRKRIIQQPVFTLADENNRHTENPLAVAGLVTALERDGDRVVATLDIKDPAVAERIADGRLPGASAFLALDAKDPQSGERAGAALLHVCGTLRPALVDLAPYESVVAACGPAWTELPDGSVCGPSVLMLCQSEIDPDPPVMLADPEPDYRQPDYQPEHDYQYGGTAGMDEDFLTGEAHRLGQLAYETSRPGRGSRPQYGTVITDRDRHAALSREREVTDEAILGLTREVAGEYGTRADVVHAMCHDTHRRSGLGHSEIERVRVLAEVGLALSAGKLEVDDDRVLALSQVYGGELEVLRLAAEPDLEDIFGLAHPQKSGRKVTTRNRAHQPDGEDASTEDPKSAIERYLQMHADEWGAEARHASRENTQSYGPSAYRPPGPSGKPQAGDRTPRRGRGTSGSVIA